MNPKENQRTEAKRDISLFPYRFPRNGSLDEINKWRRAYREWWGNNYSPYVSSEWLESPPKIFIGNQILTDKQTEAVLTESNESYGISFALNRKLSPKQLALVLSHPELSYKRLFDLVDQKTWSISNLDLLNKQKSLGMTPEEAEDAKEIATGIIKRRISLEPNGNNGGKYQILNINAVKHSVFDAKKEIKIPIILTKELAAALGIMYASGYFHGEYLKLNSPMENLQFYSESVGKLLSKTFHLPSQQPKTEHSDNPIYPKGRDTLVMEYRSKALTSFLKECVNFPKTREEKKKVGLPEIIKNAGEAEQDEFLKYFLAIAANFTKRGWIMINSVSLPLLEDIRGLLEDRVKKKSINIQRRGTQDIFYLMVGPVPTGELFIQGYFDKNQKNRNKMNLFFADKMGTRTRFLLQSFYQDQLEQFQAEALNL